MVLHKFILCSFDADMDLPHPYQKTQNFIGCPTLGLKVTLCITPILLLLLLNTATDVKDHGDLLPALCFEMAVDLVDTIKILHIVLDEKEHNYAIQNGFGHAMVAKGASVFCYRPGKCLKMIFKQEDSFQ